MALLIVPKEPQLHRAARGMQYKASKLPFFGPSNCRRVCEAKHPDPRTLRGHISGEKVAAEAAGTKEETRREKANKRMNRVFGALFG